MVAGTLLHIATWPECLTPDTRHPPGLHLINLVRNVGVRGGRGDQAHFKVICIKWETHINLKLTHKVKLTLNEKFM